MPAPAPRTMTADQFLVWRLDQEGTWELVDGVPRLKFDNGPRMMAGGTRRHARITTNLLVALRSRLRGGPCYPVGGDLAVRVSPGQVRQPDVTVECGQGGGEDLEASDPKVVFEVLSPSTRRFDLIRKADEYRRLRSLDHFLLVEPGRASVMIWTRAGADWTMAQVDGLSGEITLPAIGVALPMAEVYEDVEVDEG